MKSSRAEQVGLRKGDEILSVNGKLVSDVPADQVSKLFKGTTGSTLTMIISRKGEQSTIDLFLSRPDQAADSKLNKQLQRQVDIDDRRQH
jgi:C-terminal processing protease CtpA/Prc